MSNSNVYRVSQLYLNTKFLHSCTFQRKKFMVRKRVFDNLLIFTGWSKACRIKKLNLLVKTLEYFAEGNRNQTTKLK